MGKNRALPMTGAGRYGVLPETQRAGIPQLIRRTASLRSQRSGRIGPGSFAGAAFWSSVSSSNVQVETVSAGRDLDTNFMPLQGYSQAGMSQQNVEIVRQSFEACNRHDADAAVARYYADVEYRFVDSLEHEPVLRGRDEVKDAFRHIWQDWQETFSDPVQFFDLGDQVLVEHVDSRVGRDGIRIDDAGGQVWTFEGEVVVRIEGFATWSDALEAVGLSSQDTRAAS